MVLAPRCSKPESCHENESCAKGCLMSSPLFAPFFAGNQREGGRGEVRPIQADSPWRKPRPRLGPDG